MAPVLIQLAQFNVSIESDQAIISVQSSYDSHGGAALIAKDRTEHAMVFVRDAGSEIDEAVILEKTP